MKTIARCSKKTSFKKKRIIEYSDALVIIQFLVVFSSLLFIVVLFQPISSELITSGL